MQTSKLMIVAVAMLGACGGDPEVCVTPTVEAALCDPARGVAFTLESTNLHFPLEPGSVAIIEGDEGGVLVRVERRVLGEVEDILGVRTLVLEERVFHDAVLVEISRNHHAEAADGTVCYFGADVDRYENGVVADNEGTWRAGRGDARPGIAMPAMPKVGDAYFQENAPGIALEQGRVTAVGETRMFAGMSYDDVVTILASNPLEDQGCTQEVEKQYAPGVGQATDAGKTLVMFTPAPPELR